MPNSAPPERQSAPGSWRPPPGFPLALGQLDGVQLPEIRNALELVGSAVGKAKPAPAWANTGGDVHRDAPDVVADQLDLAGVQPDPDL